MALLADITHAGTATAVITACAWTITRITITIYALKDVPSAERPAVIRALATFFGRSRSE
ncbi:hypothetical protein ACIP5Y_23785 [Nocardia sp. NPDC088792]|uniref:hypothetical protein n=1 Tax=Nocardia sp. NPDC088792 TaxID=3364332 RepID=UPI00382A407D